MVPIFKPNAFHYDILNTRPIALLDTFRKVATKILTRRISMILSTHQVLKSFNFCGLKGEDTTTPLATLQNVLEDAREFKKELWVVTQDMKKAYNSISIDSLRLALAWIAIPPLCINWILNLFVNREIKLLPSLVFAPLLPLVTVLTKAFQSHLYCGKSFMIYSYQHFNNLLR